MSETYKEKLRDSLTDAQLDRLREWAKDTKVHVDWPGRRSKSAKGLLARAILGGRL